MLARSGTIRRVAVAAALAASSVAFLASAAPAAPVLPAPGPSGFWLPEGASLGQLAIGPGDLIYLAGGARILVHTWEGEVVGELDFAAQVDQIHRFDVRDDGLVLVIDHSEVWSGTLGGSIQHVWSAPEGIGDVVAGADGLLFLRFGDRIDRVDPATRSVSTVWDDRDTRAFTGRPDGGLVVVTVESFSDRSPHEWGWAIVVLDAYGTVRDEWRVSAWEMQSRVFQGAFVEDIGSRIHVAFGDSYSCIVRSYSEDGVLLSEVQNPLGDTGARWIHAVADIAVDSSGRMALACYFAYDDWEFVHGIVTFDPPPTGFVLDTEPSGLDVEVDGQVVSTPLAIEAPVGTVLRVGAPVHPEGGGTRHDFISWSRGAAPVQDLVVGPVQEGHLASYETFHYLDMQASPGGTVVPASGYYPAGSEIRIEAFPEAGEEFYRWTGSAVSACCEEDESLPCCRPPSYTGRETGATIWLQEPTTQYAEFRGQGYELRLSGSPSDPYASSMEPVDSIREVYLWATCLKRGIAALETRVSGSLDVYSFVPADGVLSLYGGEDLMLAIGGCPTGEDLALPLGRFVVSGGAGELCFGPSRFSGVRAVADCDPLALEAWDFVGVGFVSGPGEPCTVGTNGCDTDAVRRPQGEQVAEGRSPEDGWPDPDGRPVVEVGPNPFRGRVGISFQVRTPQPASAAIFDVRGRLVRRFDERTYGEGRHQVLWDGRDRSGGVVPAGIYFARLVVGEQVTTKRLVYLGSR